MASGTAVAPVSGAVRRPRPDLFIPSFEVPGVIGNGKARNLHEIGCDGRGNVGHGEAVSRKEPGFRERMIEDADNFGDARLVRLGPCRNLRLFKLRHGGVQMPEDLRDGKEKIELGAPVPHFDLRDFERCAAEKRRLRVQRLEIAANRNRLRNRRAIVQDQNRHALDRIERGEFRRLAAPVMISTCSKGTAIPFSARYTRTLRGFGARFSSNIFIALSATLER